MMLVPHKNHFVIDCYDVQNKVSVVINMFFFFF